MCTTYVKSDFYDDFQTAEWNSHDDSIYFQTPSRDQIIIPHNEMLIYMAKIALRRAPRGVE